MCFGILVIGRRAKCNPTVAELKRPPRCRRSGKPAELKRPPACRTITAVVHVHELWDPLAHNDARCRWIGKPAELNRPPACRTRVNQLRVRGRR